ncbi:hydrolase 1, exosortase A system-associated [Sphingomonas sp. 1P06PA]|uniref:hydrolase 1, exosortase A system-associated n=1 Tax=Sphingomonas sp. 1P06PA TaxID=554121 RepID=UPI0039A519BB
MRRYLTIACEGVSLAATLDLADGTSGLLIVSGGTETRSGPHAAMTRLALRIAAAGFPVLRFDRRGVGDSDGDDPGFDGAGADIAAAATALRAACPAVTRIVGLGTCDAASALALAHRNATLDALILINPWVVPPSSDLPPPAAIRRRYLDRLTSLDGWSRLARGRIDMRKAWRGLRSAARANEPALLAAQVRHGLAGADATVLLATGDATAQAFIAEHRRNAFPAVLHSRETGSHALIGPGDADWLAARVLGALAGP